MCVRKTLIVAAMLSAGRLAAQTISGRMNQRIYMGTFFACEPSIFVDGVTFPGLTAADLNMMVLPEEIAGVEVYTRAGSAPVQIKSMSSEDRAGRGCGSIVVWTKRFR